MFHCIPAVRNTEAKFKVETFQEFITEKMALYHAEFIHWFLSHNEFYPEIKKKILTLLLKIQNPKFRPDD